MSTAPSAESVVLYFSEGSSDKEYRAAIQQRDAGWIVTFQYGRRNASLTCGTKTPEPVAYEKAQKIYAALVREKTAKGYVAEGEGSAYQDPTFAARDTGVRPQLLTPIDVVTLHVLCGDPQFVAQEKWDGDRRLISIEADRITGINRKGLAVPLPQRMADVLRAYLADPGGRTLLDGEILGEVFAPFDLLEHAGRDLTDLSYASRLHGLQSLLGLLPPDAPVQRPYTAHTGSEKRALLDQLRAANAEGIVLKDNDAPYTIGESLAARKFKFTASATVQFGEVKQAKRSVEMFARNDVEGGLVSIGYCTIPPNAAVPAPGSLGEVNYLYCYPQGCLAQPVYKSMRTDQDQADGYSTLQFKRDATVAA